jgi:hypothetical protein
MLHLKTPELSSWLFPRYIHIGHNGTAWTMPAKLHQRSDPFFFSFKNSLNPTIGQVADPPCNTQPQGSFGGSGSEEDALNSAADVDMSSGFDCICTFKDIL